MKDICLTGKTEKQKKNNEKNKKYVRMKIKRKKKTYPNVLKIYVTQCTSTYNK